MEIQRKHISVAFNDVGIAVASLLFILWTNSSHYLHSGSYYSGKTKQSRHQPNMREILPSVLMFYMSAVPLTMHTHCT